MIKYSKILVFIFAGVLFIQLNTVNSFSQNELDVITNWPGFKNASGYLYDYLSGQAYEQLNSRSTEIRDISDFEGWQSRQQYIRKTLFDIVGPFPEKTPLNARITKTIQKEGFRVEHIIYESRPGFKVVSSLFIPDGVRKNAKLPAVIYCSGHNASGYRLRTYQHVILNLVKKGFIVLAFDPVGQGERLAYYNPETGTPRFGPTKEHSYPGAQAFITGSSQANYMIWDGIRAVDYLFTRKEVDTSRIGITGRSGGGTQSAYIAAFDDRILAVAPENYLTNYTRLLQSRGPQDSEQNFYHGICSGIDHPDFLIVRAPKPSLMILTYNDMFNIQGARDTYTEALKIYEAYGKKENMEITEDFGGHMSTKKNREAMYAFFQKHLSHPGNPRDEEIMVLTGDEIRVTPTGQLSTSVGSETVFSLNKKESEEIHSQLQVPRTNLSDWLPQVVRRAKELSGYRETNSYPEPVLTGILQKQGFIIEKYFLMGEGNYPIPYVLYIPEKRNNKAILYLHPKGKSADTTSIDHIHSLVKEGYVVLSPDLIGTGETFPHGYVGDAQFGEAYYNLWYASMLIGRSLLGIRAGDVERLGIVLKKDSRFREIYALAKGNMAQVLLHTAAFIPVFDRIVLVEPLSSYRAIVMEKNYSPDYILNSVSGALRYYDLPDLAASLAPVGLLIANPVDGAGKISDSGIIREDIEIIRKGYTLKNSQDNFVVINGEIFEQVSDFLKSKLK